jgi:hypothetical protein
MQRVRNPVQATHRLAFFARLMRSIALALATNAFTVFSLVTFQFDDLVMTIFAPELLREQIYGLT